MESRIFYKVNVIVKSFLTIFFYTAWACLRNTEALQQHLFIWLMGVWTTIYVCSIADYLEEIQKNKPSDKDIKIIRR